MSGERINLFIQILPDKSTSSAVGIEGAAPLRETVTEEAAEAISRALAGVLPPVIAAKKNPGRIFCRDLITPPASADQHISYIGLRGLREYTPVSTSVTKLSQWGRS